MIHRADCQQLAVPDRAERAIWVPQPGRLFSAGFEVNLSRSTEFLLKAHLAIHDEGAQLNSVTPASAGDLEGKVVRFVVGIHDEDHLNRVINRLAKIDGVAHIQRLLRL